MSVCLSVCVCYLIMPKLKDRPPDPHKFCNRATQGSSWAHQKFLKFKKLRNPHPSAQQGHTTSRRAGTAHLRLLTGGKVALCAAQRTTIVRMAASSDSFIHHSSPFITNTSACRFSAAVTHLSHNCNLFQTDAAEILHSI